VEARRWAHWRPAAHPWGTYFSLPCARLPARSPRGGSLFLAAGAGGDWDGRNEGRQRLVPLEDDAHHACRHRGSDLIVDRDGCLLIRRQRGRRGHERRRGQHSDERSACDKDRLPRGEGFRPDVRDERHGKLDPRGWRERSIVAGPVAFWYADEYARAPASLFTPVPGGSSRYQGA
jgi:hypothetical protein